MYHFVISTEYADWLWRLNFIIGGIAGFIIFYFRNYYQESALFLNSKKNARKNTKSNINNISQIFFKYNDRFFITMIISGLLGGSYHFMIIFINSFMFKAAGIIEGTTASSNNMILIFIYGTSVLLSGFIYDYFRSQFVILLFIIVNLTLTFALVIVSYILGNGSIIELNDYWYIFYLQCFITAFYGLYSTPIQVKLKSLFETSLRMRMYGLSHSLGSLLFSSTAPLIGTLIWSYFEKLHLVFCYFLIIKIVIFFECDLFMEEELHQYV